MFVLVRVGKILRDCGLVLRVAVRRQLSTLQNHHFVGGNLHDERSLSRDLSRFLKHFFRFGASCNYFVVHYGYPFTYVVTKLVT